MSAIVEGMFLMGMLDIFSTSMHHIIILSISTILQSYSFINIHSAVNIRTILVCTAFYFYQIHSFIIKK
jgi:hypothetical protein